MSNFDTRMRAIYRTTLVIAVLVASAEIVAAPQGIDAEASVETGPAYRVLATNRTSTLERELNQAAEEGYRLETVMGGETAFGGKEVVAIVGRQHRPGRYAYRLLATLKTSTMQEELAGSCRSRFSLPRSNRLRDCFRRRGGRRNPREGPRCDDAFDGVRPARNIAHVDVAVGAPSCSQERVRARRHDSR